jgi:tRNA (guanine26-N2/guanine27-N2)-dimethyltransferase
MIITENSSKINQYEGKLTKKLPVFYNPLMKLNRDVSILLLNSIPDKNIQMALPLSGSGIRGIRFLKELKKSKIKTIEFNDIKTTDNIKDNLKLNEFDKDKRIFLHNKDANLFMLESKGFDYIDIDPFGSPNPFLESSIIRLSRNGILAVTATDTAALCGSSPTACKRKYWAKPLRNHFMHETGLRILSRKIQLIGAQYEKALTPIFSMSKDHYFRVFFRCEKGRRKVDLLLKNHKYLLYCKKCLRRKISFYNTSKCECGQDYEFIGPLWIEKLWNYELLVKMINNCDTNDRELYDFLRIIKEESEIFEISKDVYKNLMVEHYDDKDELVLIAKEDTIQRAVTYFEINDIASILKLKHVPKREILMKKIIKKGYMVGKTHFRKNSIRTNIPYEKLIKTFNEK